jgi:hypothetical protein
MTIEELEQIFGTESTKLYKFVGELQNTETFAEDITHKFAEAAGTHLIVCTVSPLQGDYIIRTQFDYSIDSADFEFIGDLPITPPEETPE